MMSNEFRIILTATFIDAAKRDGAYSALKTTLINYAASHSGDLKRADITRDDYFIADANATEKII
jgi:hypothetical protein